MSRPMRFHRGPVPASPGYAWMGAIAGGLNQGVQNFHKAQMQRMQMEALISQRNAMMQYRQAQAAHMAPANMSNVGAALRLHQREQTGQVEYGSDNAGRVVPHYTQAALRKDPSLNDPKKLEQLQSDFDAANHLNFNEGNMVTRMSQQSVSLANAQTRANTAIAVGAAHDATRRATSPTAQMNPVDRASLASLEKARVKLMTDSGNVKGEFGGIDEARSVANKAKIKADLADTNDQIHQIHQKYSGALSPSTAAPDPNAGSQLPPQPLRGFGGQGPLVNQPPSVLPYNQRSQAGENQFVQNPSNPAYVMKMIKGPDGIVKGDGNWVPNPAAQAGPSGGRSPQSEGAPAVAGPPDPGMGD